MCEFCFLWLSSFGRLCFCDKLGVWGLVVGYEMRWLMELLALCITTLSYLISFLQISRLKSDTNFHSLMNDTEGMVRRCEERLASIGQRLRGWQLITVFIQVISMIFHLSLTERLPEFLGIRFYLVEIAHARYANNASNQTWNDFRSLLDNPLSFLHVICVSYTWVLYFCNVKLPPPNLTYLCTSVVKVWQTPSPHPVPVLWVLQTACHPLREQNHLSQQRPGHQQLDLHRGET